MFATITTASRSGPAMTAQSNWRRLNNSRLTSEISSSEAHHSSGARIESAAAAPEDGMDGLRRSNQNWCWMIAHYALTVGIPSRAFRRHPASVSRPDALAWADSYNAAALPESQASVAQDGPPVARRSSRHPRRPLVTSYLPECLTQILPFEHLLHCRPTGHRAFDSDHRRAVFGPSLPGLPGFTRFSRGEGQLKLNWLPLFLHEMTGPTHHFQPFGPSAGQPTYYALC